MSAAHASRMRSELLRFEQDPPPGVAAWIVGDRKDLLHAVIKGPVDTPYADGKFELEILVTARYPFDPPAIRFLTPIYHPNIDSAGRICLDALNMPPKGSWSPRSNLATVLTMIQQLLADPNPDDGLMAEITKHYRDNREGFNLHARQMTVKHAMKDDSAAAKNITTQQDKQTTITSAPQSTDFPATSSSMPSVSTTISTSLSTTTAGVKRPLESAESSSQGEAEQVNKKQKRDDEVTFTSTTADDKKFSTGSKSNEISSENAPSAVTVGEDK